jgi:hypothetical protein
MAPVIFAFFDFNRWDQNTWHAEAKVIPIVVMWGVLFFISLTAFAAFGIKPTAKQKNTPSKD